MRVVVAVVVRVGVVVVVVVMVVTVRPIVLFRDTFWGWAWISRK